MTANRIGPYEVIDPLFSRGGQSNLVEAVRDGQPYVLKLLMAGPDDREASARFDLEIEILRAINHPNIVRYVDDGVHNSIRYVAMPRLPGQNLRRELQGRRQLDPLRVAHIGRQLATAIQVFHQLGAVHRDVKPENVQVDDQSDHVWLLDPGYARYVRKTRITNPDGPPPGTEGYRAPEILHGYTYKQSDFYSLGLLLYEMVAGQHPFDHRDPDAKSRVVPLRQVVPDCPRFVASAVDFLLAWEVRYRPQTAAEVLALLEDPAHGLRVVSRIELLWSSKGALPLIFRLSDANLISAQRAAEAQVRPDAYMSCGSGNVSRSAAVAAADAKRDLLIDPELHQIAYTGFESVPGFASTICSDYGHQPLGLDDLHDPTTVRTIARISLDLEAELGGTVKVVPGFVVNDTKPDGWLGCNSGLLDECIDVMAKGDPFAVRVLASLEAAATPTSRQRFADAIGRHNPDLFLVSFDGLRANASCEQLLRALELVQPLQRVGCCVICDGAGLAPFWFAFGLGVSFDLMAEAPLNTRPSSWTSARFEFPSLLTSLRLEDAQAMLERGDTVEANCPCFSCRSATSIAECVASAPAHNAAMASRERAEALSRPLELRRSALQSRVASARTREMAAAVGRWEARVKRLDSLAMALTTAETRVGVEAA